MSERLVLTHFAKKSKVEKANFSKNMDNCSKNMGNCSKNKKVEANCSKNIDYCSKRKVWEENCSKNMVIRRWGKKNQAVS